MCRKPYLIMESIGDNLEIDHVKGHKSKIERRPEKSPD